MNLFMKSTSSCHGNTIKPQLCIGAWRFVGAILVSVLISLKIKQNITAAAALHAEIIRTTMR
jgi:hypothetical protein